MAARRAVLVLGLAALTVSGIMLAACGQKTPKASDANTLTIAATAIPHAEVLEFIEVARDQSRTRRAVA